MDAVASLNEMSNDDQLGLAAPVRERLQAIATALLTAEHDRYERSSAGPLLPRVIEFGAGGFPALTLCTHEPRAHDADLIYATYPGINFSATVTTPEDLQTLLAVALSLRGR